MSDFDWTSQITLLRLEAFLQTHGSEIYVWETADSPTFECYGIRVDEDFWLTMLPDYKGEPGKFIRIVPNGDVGFCEE